MSRDEIKAYQKQLALAGFYEGDIDGLWGPQTQRAHLLFIAPKAQKVETNPIDDAGEDVKKISARIIAAATKYLNLTEVAPNAKWDNLNTRGEDPTAKELLTAMLATGWQTGWPYCAAFAEACWREGYAGRPELPLIAKNITPSAMGTWENFSVLKRTTQKPFPGALMIWQNGTSWQGHVGIVVEAAPRREMHVITIEGNTAPNPSSVQSDREGDGVYRKTRLIDFTQKSKGLNLKGFINPFII